MLVEWDPYTLETLNSVFYDISYGSTNSDEANSVSTATSLSVIIEMVFQFNRFSEVGVVLF